MRDDDFQVVRVPQCRLCAPPVMSCEADAAHLKNAEFRGEVALHLVEYDENDYDAALAEKTG